MLLLSNMLIFISFGVSYAWVLFMIIRRARKAPLQAPVEQALILGKNLQSGNVDEEFRQRLERGVELYRHHGVQRLIVLGGRTDRHGPSEAEAGRAVLLALGVPDRAIACEEASRHTLENLRNARDLLGAALKDRIGLVSNRYHLARCQSMAEGLALNVEPIAAESRPGEGKAGAILLEAYLYHWYLVGHFLAHRLRDQSSIDQIS